MRALLSLLLLIGYAGLWIHGIYNTVEEMPCQVSVIDLIPIDSKLTHLDLFRVQQYNSCSKTNPQNLLRIQSKPQNSKNLVSLPTSRQDAQNGEPFVDLSKDNAKTLIDLLNTVLQNKVVEAKVEDKSKDQLLVYIVQDRASKNNVRIELKQKLTLARYQFSINAKEACELIDLLEKNKEGLQ